MARLHRSRLLVLSLIAGAAAACNDPQGGGPTSDFPFTGNGDYSMADAATRPPAVVDGGASPVMGLDGGSPAEGAGGEAGVGVASDAGPADAGCHDPDAGDAAADANATMPADAQSDAAPDPCEGGEGGTSADGQAGS